MNPSLVRLTMMTQAGSTSDRARHREPSRVDMCHSSLSASLADTLGSRSRSARGWRNEG